jgi:hypothetical protein
MTLVDLKHVMRVCTLKSTCLHVFANPQHTTSLHSEESPRAQVELTESSKAEKFGFKDACFVA